jgi:hypothetical protein
MRRTIFLSLFALLSISAPAYPLGHVITGNEPLTSDLGYGNEFLATVNTIERVYMYVHDSEVTAYVKGGLSEEIRDFVAGLKGKS